MPQQLIQKSGLKTISFIIEDTGLLKKIKSKQVESEQHFPFEQIGTNRATLLDHNKGMFTIGIILAGIALITLISDLAGQDVEKMATPLWATFSAVFFVLYFRSRKKKLFLQMNDNRNIEFSAGKENLEEVSKFIENIISERNTYLISKYGLLNKNLDFSQQLENLNWLLNSRAISKKDYDLKVGELNALFSSSSGNNRIGFSSTN